ncbi:MAG: ABC transporter substrate-binding protein [Thermoleophilia bacterium]
MLLLAAVLLAIVGCSSTTSTTDTTAGSVPDLSGQTMEVAAVWSGAEQANFQKVIDAFQEQSGAVVTFTSTGDQIATVLGTRIQGGSPPDVAFLPQPGLMYSFAEQGALQPLTDVIGMEMDSNFAPVWKDLGTYGDTQYGLVFKAANKSTMWYNVSVFSDAGVEPPTTWEELLAAADTLQRFGVAPFSVAGADGWTLTDWFENVYLRVAGGEKYDQLTTLEIPWTDPSVTTALDELAKIWGNDAMLSGGATGALQTDFPTSVVNAFASPAKAAMVYEGDFVAGVITSETSAALGTDADFFDFPSIDGSPASVVGGGDMAVLMTDSEVGKAFMKFLTTPEAAAIWAALGGFSSPNKNVDPSVYPDDITRKAATALANAEVVRFDMSDLEPPAFGGTPGKGEWKLLQDFLSDSSDVSGIQTQLQDAAAAAATGS